MIPLPWFCDSFQFRIPDLTCLHLVRGISRHLQRQRHDLSWFHIFDCARANGSNDTLFRIALIGSNIFLIELRSKKRSTHGFGWKKHSSIVLPQDLSRRAVFVAQPQGFPESLLVGFSCNNEPTPSLPAAHSFPEASMSNKIPEIFRKYQSLPTDKLWCFRTMICHNKNIHYYAVYNNDRFCNLYWHKKCEDIHMTYTEYIYISICLHLRHSLDAFHCISLLTIPGLRVWTTRNIDSSTWIIFFLHQKKKHAGKIRKSPNLPSHHQLKGRYLGSAVGPSWSSLALWMIHGLGPQIWKLLQISRNLPNESIITTMRFDEIKWNGV